MVKKNGSSIESLTTDSSAQLAKNAVHKLSEKEEDVFLLDSGAFDHIAWCLDGLESIEEITPKEIALGNSQKVFATHKWTLLLQLVLEIPGEMYDRTAVLHDVMYVTELDTTLISFCMLCDIDYNIYMRGDKCNELYDGITMFQGRKCRGVLRIIAKPIRL